MKNMILEQVINQKINSSPQQDYAPNGLQVEGRQDVQRIVTGVTASQALLDQALTHSVDAIIVHHGYFWKNESPIISGIKRRRLKTLLANDINLYAWHLPLDIHPELGNNAQLAMLLGLLVTGHLNPLVPEGEFQIPLSPKELKLRLEERLKRRVLHCGENGPPKIKRVAWCSGGGQGFIELASRAGMDAFITGEISEQSIHISREQGLHFYAAGHHATERGGIRTLGAWLTQQYGFDVLFIDIDNPA
ncbi:type 2 GTP cyclohydrolase I [Candidatus Steffania adelgidicola]|uniref:type 2 GTP cyclohydrolase I n=1 Tax=Candidatus Steffania adelgidicola TaxID=1076626 RepID=UPI001D01511B|nr:type 2 GTP cyclohydrolase I [Candidatus Steffania adelgidicola]UDG79551.1 GTP cyclohydrolase 1 type 2 [Candidatus Steffania adelgidicola]